MLVLTRRVDAGDQSVIRIGDDIEVSIVEVRGGQVRLGITAPKGVPVHRDEVYHEKQLEKRAAGKHVRRKEMYHQVQQENQAAADTPFATALMFLGH